MTDVLKKLGYRYALIAVAILAVYCNTLRNGFVWDDIQIIVENPLLKNLAFLPRLLLSEDRFAEAASGYYRPITYLSFAWDRTVWGLNPLGFNLTNILLQILVALLFYRVVFALFKRENLALVAALIFALHPVAGETVNFHAGGRNTLLCASFALLSLLFHINKKLLPALLCFTLAIFSKEFALLMPVMFVIYDRFVSSERRRWFSYAAYLVPIAGYFALRSYVVAARGNLFKTMQLGDNLLLIPRIVSTYFLNMIAPFRLKALYEVPADFSVLTIGMYSLLVLALAGVVVYFRAKKEVSFSAAWFILFLAPVSNIFPLGAAMIADRYAYFSLMGFCLLLAYCLCQLPARAVVAVTAGICVCFSVVDFTRNGLWKDDLTLFTEMAKNAPGKVLAFQNLGITYYNAGDLPNAEKNLAAAFAKDDLTDKTIHTLSAIYWETGKLDKAVPLMLKSLENDPENPQPNIMLSRLYQAQGDRERAKKYHDKAAALMPKIEQMMSMRAGALCREGEKLMTEHKVKEAERKYREALMMTPDFNPALLDLGSAAAEAGNLPKAIEYFTKAATLEPLNPAGHYNLSVALELTGRQAEAREEMSKFKELDARAASQRRPAP
jgi:protein O-mannosyl-transferase